MFFKRIVFLVLCCVIVACENQPELNYTSGPVFGTSYSIQFIANDSINHTNNFNDLFDQINQSMSTYSLTSDISKLNRNEEVTIDNHFINVFDTSRRIYNETNGYFDPTIGMLVNAWDFGPEKPVMKLDSVKIDSLLKYVGFDKLKRDNQKIIKKYPQTYIDFNAIAKGYAVDVVYDFLQEKGYTDFLVEIGGEIRAKGTNKLRGKPWTVGIDDPNFDGSRSIHKAFEVDNMAMAGSGTYRKFKIDENGNRYAHIINTATGYPSKTNVLSVTVLAKTCMEADAYATSFKAMGITKTKAFLKKHPEVKVYFIYEGEDKELKTLALNNFPIN